MAKSKKAGRKPAAQPATKAAVLIEMKVPRTMGQRADLTATSTNLAEQLGIKLDPDFTPVSVTPSNTQRNTMLAAGEDNEHMLLRAELSATEVDKLKKNPNVVEVWTDAPIEPFACPIPPCDCTPGTPKGNILDVANYLGVNQIWAAGKKGAGIIVGVVDGGICASGRTLASGEAPAKLINNVIGGWPVASWGTQGKSWGYHGSMCATDVQGMAPDVKLYDLRIASGTIGGTISNAISAYDWAINQHKSNGTPHVLTNSWGMFQKSWATDYATNPNHPFTRKVVEAIDEGILVLFAAGNCGDTCPDGRCSTDAGPSKSIWGANGHTKVMTVGAVNKNEQFVGYSSQGPAALDPHKPDFCSITHFTGYFNSDSGTSAATPIAAGLVALLKQAKPSASQSQIKQALISTAKDIGAAGWDQHSGAGIIQGKKAYDKLIGKLIIKELKNEKLEIKELKREKVEIKEAKREKLEKIEIKENIKEHKSEKLEIDERIDIPGKPIGLQAQAGYAEASSLESRVQNLEAVLSSFIDAQLRPDLSAGALKNEMPSGYQEALYAEQQKIEFDNMPA